ncbi:fimbrial protein [Photorhabdus aegyptia]|uniref:P pilus assembly protein, pilin FimA n=1 Tax=Photorhabdus aegyptia TaxID=2805098 RepID=A0A022PHF2_9GAMM|nr:fimbrial protein [Photorhabdus aegyptia]EYU13935.1 P pilus assembly protein, pilin FimA [Photorhabdus aegyptia]
MRKPWALIRRITLACLFCTASQPGGASSNTAELTLALTLEQPTCELNMQTSSPVVFSSVPLTEVRYSERHIAAAGSKPITLALSGCAGSARAGRAPAIKIIGATSEDHPTLFRDKASTVAGNVGFGLRYQLPGGGLGSYLKNGDYVNLAPPGNAAKESQITFQMNMRHEPGTVVPTPGELTAHIQFQFDYH